MSSSLQVFTEDQIRNHVQQLGINNFSKMNNGNIEIELTNTENRDVIIKLVIDSLTKYYLSNIPKTVNNIGDKS